MRMRRWLIAVVVMLGTVVVLPSPAVAAPSGTISFSIAGNPSPGVPFSITVSGTNSQEGTLLVYVFLGSPAMPGERIRSAGR